MFLTLLLASGAVVAVIPSCGVVLGCAGACSLVPAWCASEKAALQSEVKFSCAVCHR